MTEALATAIVLLYDVVGSTSMRSDLGDAEAERRFRALDEDARRVVEAAGGEVIKGTGDGQLVSFASAGDALTAAAAIQRAARGVSLRMGVAAGDVRRDERDLYGTPTVEAARLCDAADEGQVLVTDVVRALAGSWHSHPLTDAGRLELKGLAAPLQAWALEWNPATISVHKRTLLVDEEFPFVGRRDELDQLHQAWSEATAGEARVVCLAGEPGVGKTRLAVEFAAGLPSGTMVLAGRCDREQLTPLGGFVEAIGVYADETSLEELRSVTASGVETLARYVPQVNHRLGVEPVPPLGDAGLESRRFNESIVAMLDAISDIAPLLVILDDVQWADEATRRLVTKLVRRRVVARTMILATLRDTADDLTPEFEEWVRALGSTPGVNRVTVPDLTSLDVEQLAVAALGDRGRTVARSVFGQTGGHGFYTSEILRQLVTGGDDHHALPPSITELILDRLAHLSGDVTTLLSTGALIGLAFDLPVVVDASGLGDAEGLDAIEAALAARLVLEEGVDRYQFTHGLVPSALAQQLSGSRRVRLHRAIADALTTRGAPTSDVARHLVAAVPVVDPEVARNAALVAAEGAREALRFDHAAALFGLALDVPGSERAQTEILLRQGQAWNENGSPAFGVPMFRHAFELAERNRWWDLLAEAALGIWDTDPWRDNRSTEAAELLERAAGHLDDLSTGVAARVLAQQASFSILSRSLRHRRELADRAWEMVQSVDDDVARQSVLRTRWVAIACPKTRDLLPPMDDELDRLAQRLDRRMDFGDAASRETAYFWCGDGDAFRGWRDELESRQHARRDIDVWRLHSLNASIALAEGCTDDARTLATQAFEAGRDAWNDTARAIHSFVIATADRIDGRPEASRDRVSALADAVGGPIVRLLVAWIDAEAGRPEAAAATLARIGSDRLRVFPEHFLGTIALVAAAGTACALGDRAWMQVAYETLLPLEDQMCGIPWAPLPAAGHFLGQLAAGLGDSVAAANHHSEGDRIHSTFGAPGFAEYSRHRRGGRLA